MSRFEKWANRNNVHHMEGSEGVKNLCKFVRTLGYKDPMCRMQLSHDAAIGDLLYFLEDNPQAIEAIIEFVDDNAKVYPDENGDEDEDEDEDDIEDHEDEDDVQD